MSTRRTNQSAMDVFHKSYFWKCSRRFE